MSNRIINPRTEYYAIEHFMGFRGDQASTAISPSGVFGFNRDFAGTSASVLYTASTSTACGIVQCNTGSTSSGVAQLIPGTNNVWFGSGGGYYRSDFRIRVPILSTSGERYIIRIGYVEQLPPSMQYGVIWVLSDNINSGQWRCSVYDNTLAFGGSTPTNYDTSITPTANVWYRLGIAVSGNGLTYKFYIDNVLVGTLVGNGIQPNGVRPVCSIIKSVGTTARTLDTDWCDLYVRWNTQII